MDTTNNNNDEDKKIIKVDLSIVIASIIAEYKSPFTFKVVLKIGDKSFETDRANKYSNGKKEIPLEEPFKLSTNFVVDVTNSKINPQMLKFYLLVLTSSGYKPATSGDYNLAQVDLEKENNLVLDFKKHSLTYLKIKFRINTLSMNLINYDSKTEKEFNFEYLNLKTGTSNAYLDTTVDQSFSNLNLNNTMNFHNTLGNQHTIVQNKNIKADTFNSNNINTNNNNSINKNNHQFKVKATATTNFNNNDLSKPVIVKPQLNKDINNLNKEVVDGDTEKNALKDKEEIENLKCTINQNINSIAKLNEENKGLSDKLEYTNRINDTIKKENAVLNQKLLDLENLTSDTKKEENSKIEKLCSENKQLKADIEESKNKLINFTNKTMEAEQRLKSEYISLENKYSIKDKEYESLKNNNEEQSIYIKELNNDIKFANDKITSLNNEIISLSNKLNSSEQKLKLTEEDSNNRNSIIKANEGDLRQELLEKEEIIKQLKISNSSNEDEVNQLNLIIKDLKLEKSKIYNEKISSNKSHMAEVLDYKERLNNMSDTIQNLNSDNEKTNAELSNKIKLIEEISNELQLIKELNIKNNNEILNLNNQINNDKELYDNKIEELNSVLTLKDNNNREYQDSIIEKDDKINHLNNLIEEYKQFKEKYNNISDDLIKVKQANINLENEVESLKNNNNQDNNNLSLKCFELEKENNIIKQNESELMNKIRNLKEELETLESINNNNEKNQLQYKKALQDVEQKYKEEIINFKAKTNTYENNIIELNNLIEDKSILIENLNKEINKLKENSANNEVYLEEIESMKDKFEIRENDLKAEMDFCLNKKQDEINKLKEELKQLDNLSEFEYQMNKAKNENKILREEIDKYKKEEDMIDKLNKDIMILERKLNENNVYLESSKSEINLLKEKNINVKEELELLNMKIKQKDELITNLEKDVVSKTEKIGDLLNEISEFEQKALKDNNNNNNNNKNKRFKFL